MTKQRTEALLYFVGDLHAYPWRVLADGAQGDNKHYEALRRLFDLLAQEIVEQRLGSVPGDAIVFLGDLAEEPYKRGTIAVDSLQCLCDGFERLGAASLDSDLPLPFIAVAAGNHDYVAPGRSWMRGVLPDYVTVVDTGVQTYDVGACTAEDGSTTTLRLCLVPYATPQTTSRALTQRLAGDGVYIVAGHFLLPGARMDNGHAYDAAECVDSLNPAAARNVYLYVLGHAHTANNMMYQEAPVIYPGLPIPYSHAVERPGEILQVAACVEEADGVVLPLQVRRTLPVPDVPRFVTIDLTDADAADNVPPGAYCRVKVPPAMPDAHDAMTDLRKRRPEVRFTPVYEAAPAQPGQPTTQARCMALAAGAADDLDRYEALRAYMAFAGHPEGLDKDEVLQAGRALVGDAGGEDEEGNPTGS